MNVLLYIFKIHLISVYFFIKLFTRQKKQVFLLSRQYDNIPLNYRMLIDELKREKITYRILCKKIDASINDSIRTQGHYSNTKKLASKMLKNFKSAFSYYFSLYKQMRLIASSKVIIVDGYNIPVSVLKHKRGTRVIQMWHALGAIKKFGFQSVGTKDGISQSVSRILKMHANYDYILSGSKAMNPYFAQAFNTDINKVLPIGTPTADYMKLNDPQIREKILKKYPSMNNKINILYSPTFRNDKRDNTNELIKYIDFQKCNLIITKHPKVDTIVNDDRIICIESKEFSTYDIVKMVDYVITDYSALMIDAAIADKKILLYVYDYETYKVDNGLNIDLIKEFPGLTKRNAQDIMNIIVHDQYPLKEYTKFKNKYTPNMKNSSMTEIVKLVRSCLSE